MNSRLLAAFAGSAIWCLTAQPRAAPAMTSQLGTARILRSAPEPGADTVELVVASLRDVGASMPKGADGRPINDRFTGALREHLGELAKGAYEVRDRSKADKATLRLRLEGEMAHTDGDPPDGGAYLCTLRLYEDKRPRRLIGQWSGTAATLRDLTSNLRHDPKTSPLGLLGELGRKVDAAARAQRKQTTADLVRKALERCTGSSEPEIGLAVNPGDEAKKSVSPGERYRVSIRSPRGGQMWLLALSEDGRASLLLGGDSGVPIGEDAPATVPSRGLFTAPRSGRTMTLISFIKPSDGDSSPTHRRSSGIEKETSPVRGEDRETAPSVADGPGVEVISTFRPLDPASADAESLLQRIAADRPGSWLARKVDVPMVQTR